MHTKIKKITSTQKIGRNLYDHSPLAKTLDKYIDYKKLNLAKTQVEQPEVVRLIITAVDCDDSTLYTPIVHIHIVCIEYLYGYLIIGLIPYGK